MRRGFSMIEILLVLGITAVLATAAAINLQGRKSSAELTTTAGNIVSLLREAQSRSMSQASSTAWGVHFENGTSSFYALFSGTYSTSSREAVYSLPAALQYVTSTVASSRYIEMTFAQISGLASGSSSVAIARKSSPSSSSTITLDPSGAISY
jgi:prepilin-type N-terminal cleavage/methylation domain-containing protein